MVEEAALDCAVKEKGECSEGKKGSGRVIRLVEAWLGRVARLEEWGLG